MERRYQFCWLEQGGLAGGWNSVLLENIQMEERGRKEEAKKNERILKSCDRGAEKPARVLLQSGKEACGAQAASGRGHMGRNQQAAV